MRLQLCERSLLYRPIPDGRRSVHLSAKGLCRYLRSRRLKQVRRDNGAADRRRRGESSHPILSRS